MRNETFPPAIDYALQKADEMSECLTEEDYQKPVPAEL